MSSGPDATASRTAASAATGARPPDWSDGPAPGISRRPSTSHMMRGTQARTAAPNPSPPAEPRTRSWRHSVSIDDRQAPSDPRSFSRPIPARRLPTSEPVRSPSPHRAASIRTAEAAATGSAARSAARCVRAAMAASCRVAPNPEASMMLGRRISSSSIRQVSSSTSSEPLQGPSRRWKPAIGSTLSRCSTRERSRPEGLSSEIRCSPGPRAQREISASTSCHRGGRGVASAKLPVASLDSAATISTTTGSVAARMAPRRPHGSGTSRASVTSAEVRPSRTSVRAGTRLPRRPARPSAITRAEMRSASAYRFWRSARAGCQAGRSMKRICAPTRAPSWRATHSGE